jgi:pimeloyl-ACP methyl ester carboxylesterase
MEVIFMHSLIKYAVISDEVKLPYIEKGDVSGIPVIFLHGITDSLRSFDLMLPHLPERIHAFVVTQRGHGDASRPQNGYFARDFAADIAAFMDYVGIEKAVIVGHSMGSHNAQRFAIDYPSRVSGLVLIGSFTACKNIPGVVDFVENEVVRLKDPVPYEFAREFQESAIEKPIPKTFLEMAIRESLKVPARVWQAAFESLLLEDNADELDKIKAPTLLLWGEKDAFFPRSEQEKLLSKIENSVLTVLRETGHTPHWEEPERTAEEIVNFINRSVGEKSVVSREFVYLS